MPLPNTNSCHPRPRASRLRIVRNRTAAGFTLIEAMLAIMIIGFAVTGLMLLLTSGTQVNSYGAQLSTSVFLAELTQALTDEIAFEDLPSYDGLTFAATNADGETITELNHYQQDLTVTGVDPTDLSTYTGSDPQALMLRVGVSYAGNEVTNIAWLRTQ